MKQKKNDVNFTEKKFQAIKFITNKLLPLRVGSRNKKI